MMSHVTGLLADINRLQKETPRRPLIATNPHQPPISPAKVRTTEVSHFFEDKTSLPNPSNTSSISLMNLRYALPELNAPDIAPDLSSKYENAASKIVGKHYGPNGCLKLVKDFYKQAGISTAGLSNHISSIETLRNQKVLQTVANKSQLQKGDYTNIKPGDIFYSEGHVGIVKQEADGLHVIHNSSSRGYKGVSIPLKSAIGYFPDQVAILRFSPEALASRMTPANPIQITTKSIKPD